MATGTAVLANGPVAYTDSTGAQVEISLSALSFGTNGSLTLSGWPPFGNYSAGEQKVITGWLNALISSGFLKPSPDQPPRPAMLLQAADAGAAGNNISVAVSAVVANADPSQTTFTVMVTETDAYTGLSAATIAGVLGTDQKPLDGSGPKPGLVHVVNGSVVPAGIPDMTKSPYSFPTPPANKNSQVNVVDTTPATIFTLEAKKPGKDGKQITATLSNLNGKVFDMQVTFTKQVTGVTILNAAQKLADLGYEIGTTAPGGGAFSVPAAKTTTLTGGADGGSPLTASAILVAG
jgi:hypothetical protein